MSDVSELDGTVNHLRKQLDSSEDIASDLRKQLSSTTIEVRGHWEVGKIKVASCTLRQNYNCILLAIEI